MPTTSTPVVDLVAPVPQEWADAADALESTDYQNFAAPVTDQDALSVVVDTIAELNRQRLPFDSRVLLNRWPLVRFSLETALARLTPSQTKSGRTLEEFVAERRSSPLPNRRRIAREIRAVVQNQPRDALAKQLASQLATPLKLKTGEPERLVAELRADMTSVRPDQLMTWAEARRAEFRAGGTASASGTAPAPDPVGARVGASFRCGPPLAAPGAAVTTYASVASQGAPRRIDVVGTLFALYMSGERALMFDAAETARTKFATGELDLAVCDDDDLPDVLYLGLPCGSLDRAARSALFAKVGLGQGTMPDSVVDEASRSLMAQVLQGLNTYSAARCLGEECARPALAALEGAIRRLRAHLGRVITPYTAVQVRALHAQLDNEVRLLDRMSSTVFRDCDDQGSPGPNPWPAVQKLVGDRLPPDLDFETIEAEADAWNDVLQLVISFDGIDPDTISAEALDAAALLAPTSVTAARACCTAMVTS